LIISELYVGKIVNDFDAKYINKYHNLIIKFCDNSDINYYKNFVNDYYDNTLDDIKYIDVYNYNIYDEKTIINKLKSYYNKYKKDYNTFIENFKKLK